MVDSLGRFYHRRCSVSIPKLCLVGDCIHVVLHHRCHGRLRSRCRQHILHCRKSNVLQSDHVNLTLTLYRSSDTSPLAWSSQPLPSTLWSTARTEPKKLPRQASSSCPWSQSSGCSTSAQPHKQRTVATLTPSLCTRSSVVLSASLAQCRMLTIQALVPTPQSQANNHRRCTLPPS
jgi:hypothetical protein